MFSTDIVDGEVKTPDLATSAVTNGKVATNAVTAAKIAGNAVSTGKVADNNLTANDIANTNSLGPAEIGGLGGAEITNFSLNDEDISQGTFVNFAGNIGSVPSHDCVDRQVTGVNARLDHVLLSPDWNNSDFNLSYTVLYSSQTGTDEGFVMIRVCNPTDATVNDGTTDFNLLVIDSQ